MERSQSSLATRKLYEAALKGDVPSLLNLLGEDPLILKRCIIQKSDSFMQSPLHVAANFGYSNFTEEITKHKPELVEVVDQIKRSSPLHIASAKGHLQVVETLLAVNPSICYTHDRDGMTPFHLAAIKGSADVLHALLRAEPQAAWELTSGGETVLHLCVKHKQVEALKILVKATHDELLNFEDTLGNTVLHLAVAAEHPEMVQFLSELKMIEKNATNKQGLTALDTHKRRKTDSTRYKKISECLEDGKALPGKEALKQKKDRAWLEDQRTSLMVVASLIATMAFQVGINPPGGIWQDDKISDTYNYGRHFAGTSIWSYTQDSNTNSSVVISNSIALMSSLSVILLLISGLPFKRLLLSILRITLWISVTSIAFTYTISVFNLSFSGGWRVHFSLRVSVMVWLGLMGTIVAGHVVRFIHQIRQSIKIFCKRCYLKLMTNTTIIESNFSNHV